MEQDKRYASGTSLDRTHKELLIDFIDELIDLDDELFIALKKMNQVEIGKLHDKIKAALDSAKVAAKRR